MYRQRPQIRKIVFLSITSFVFNFVWEWIQCDLFFVHRGNRAVPLSMVTAAFGDVLLTFVIIGLALFVGDRPRYSLKKLATLKGLFLIEIFAFAAAAVIEKFALATNRWSYTDLNPMTPLLDISLIPILQMMLLTPAVVYGSLLAFRRTKVQ